MHDTTRTGPAPWRRGLGFAALAAILIALLAACSQTTGGDATLGSEAAMGRYIVVLDVRADRVNPGVGQARAADVARAFGLSPSRTYGAALVGFAAFVPEARLATLRADPRVAYVERDDPVQLYAQEIPTGIDRIFATGNANVGIDGTDDFRVDVDVAVIDTGVDYQHPDLNVMQGVDCSGGGPFGGSCGPGGDDDHYHGTHVAGTIAALDNGIGVVGVAPGARIWPVKVLNQRGSGYTSWIVAGIDWVAANADTIEVANMSLGGSGFNQAEYDAIQGAKIAGVAFAVAAGNSNADANNYSPAAFDNVLTVSALADFDGASGGNGSPTCRSDEDDTLANFSNWGTAVDIAAPGTCILSTFPLEQGEYGTISGTSMASPHVAGALALLASTNNPGNAGDVEALYAQVISAGNSDWTDDSGDGIKERLLDVSGFSATTVAGSGGGTQADAAPTVTISSPADGATFDSGASIVFSGSASDEPDGPLTADLTWTSDLVEGPIGSGGTFSTILADGTHTITASVTDSGGTTSTEVVTITVGTSAPPPPSSSPITLDVGLEAKSKGVTPVTLAWTGTTTETVEIHLNGSFYESMEDRGSTTYSVRGGGTFTFKVCDLGGATCSNSVTVSF